MITSLAIRGLLSFGWDEVRIPLRALNIAVGANASGKTNLLDCLDLLRSMADDYKVLLERKGGAADWVHKVAAAQVEPSLSVVIEDERFGSPLHQQFTWDADLGLIRESVRTRDDHGAEGPFPFLHREGDSVSLKVFSAPASEQDPTFGGYHWEEIPFGAAASVVASFSGVESLPFVRPLLEHLRGIWIHQGWAFGPGTPVRKPQPADLPDDRLRPDGSNLAHVLARLQRNEVVRERLRQELRRAYEQVDDVRVSQTDRTTIYLTERGHDGIIPGSRISDGTLRWLALLAILLDPAPPTLVCLEEPELGLHPDLIASLAALLKDAATRTQVLLTTHSEALVSEFSDRPEDVLVFDRPFDATVVKRLMREPLATWLDQYSLGHVWMSGELGGRRW